MEYDEIIKLFESDKFDNDIWNKIDFILSKTNDYSEKELINIYDEM